MSRVVRARGEPELKHHAAFHDDPIAKLSCDAREESVEHHQLALAPERPPRQDHVGPSAGSPTPA